MYKITSLMYRIILLLVVVVVFSGTVAAAFTPPTAAELAAAADSFLLRPGVVIDPARGVVYLMEPGGVVARDLASGDELWASSEAAQPLGLYGGLLIALAEPVRTGAMEVVFLEVGHGDREALIPVALRGGVTAMIDGQPHRRFDVTSVVSGGEVFLFWAFTTRELRGAPAAGLVAPRQGSSGHLASVAKSTGPSRLEGVLRLELATLRAVPPAPGAAPAPPAPRIPDLQPGESLADVAGRQFRAADGRHVLASDRTADSRTWERYRWTIFDRTTGARIGELDQPRSTAAFVVTGSTLVYESQPYARRLDSGELEARELALIAVDLANGHELWSASLRDTAYRGPFPP